MNKLKMISKILSPIEYAKFISVENDTYDDVSLRNLLIELGIITISDWKYLEENALYNFIDERLFTIAQTGLEENNVFRETMKERYDMFHPKSDYNKVTFAMGFYSTVLKTTPARLLLRDTGDDFYDILVVPASSVQKLKKIRSEFWKFYTR